MPGELSGCIDAYSLADKGRCESLTLFVRAALVYSKVPAVFLDRFFSRSAICLSLNCQSEIVLIVINA